MRKLTSFFVLILFLVSAVNPPAGFAQTFVGAGFMPEPGTVVASSQAFTPAHLLGVVIDQKDPLKFDFLIQKGDTPLDDRAKNVEYKKLIKYFLAAMTIPDTDQWVNLSPYENDRIIQENFGMTEMGRDLLAQDYLLKQLTASLIHPDTDLGKEFWTRVYQKAKEKFGNTDVPLNAFNKVWISPDKAVVWEKANTAYVVESHLKVLTEEDYLSQQKNSNSSVFSTEGVSDQAVSEVAKLSGDIVREVLVPEIEKEVNQGKHFAPLRQIVASMILATWYKQALKESLLGKIYADRAKVVGVDQDPKNNTLIYDQYVAAFKKGVVNLIREDIDQYSQEIIPRKYFSGGFDRAQAPVTVTRGTRPPASAKALLDAAQKATVDRASVALNSVGVGEEAKFSNMRRKQALYWNTIWDVSERIDGLVRLVEAAQETDRVFSFYAWLRVMGALKSYHEFAIDPKTGKPNIQGGGQYRKVPLLGDILSAVAPFDRMTSKKERIDQLLLRTHYTLRKTMDSLIVAVTQAKTADQEFSDTRYLAWQQVWEILQKYYQEAIDEKSGKPKLGLPENTPNLGDVINALFAADAAQSIGFVSARENMPLLDEDVLTQMKATLIQALAATEVLDVKARVPGVNKGAFKAELARLLRASDTTVAGILEANYSVQESPFGSALVAIAVAVFNNLEQLYEIANRQADIEEKYYAIDGVLKDVREVRAAKVSKESIYDAVIKAFSDAAMNEQGRSEQAQFITLTPEEFLKKRAELEAIHGKAPVKSQKRGVDWSMSADQQALVLDIVTGLIQSPSKQVFAVNEAEALEIIVWKFLSNREMVDVSEKVVKAVFERIGVKLVEPARQGDMFPERKMYNIRVVALDVDFQAALAPEIKRAAVERAPLDPQKVIEAMVGSRYIFAESAESALAIVAHYVKSRIANLSGETVQREVLQALALKMAGPHSPSRFFDNRAMYLVRTGLVGEEGAVPLTSIDAAQAFTVARVVSLVGLVGLTLLGEPLAKVPTNGLVNVPIFYVKAGEFNATNALFGAGTAEGRNRIMQGEFKINAEKQAQVVTFLTGLGFVDQGDGVYTQGLSSCTLTGDVWRFSGLPEALFNMATSTDPLGMLDAIKTLFSKSLDQVPQDNIRRAVDLMLISREQKPGSVAPGSVLMSGNAEGQYRIKSGRAVDVLAALNVLGFLSKDQVVYRRGEETITMGPDTITFASNVKAYVSDTFRSADARKLFDVMEQAAWLSKVGPYAPTADPAPVVQEGADKTDKAEETRGGIDLNAATMKMQIKRDGNGIALPVGQQDLENIRINGLVPEILSIMPAPSLPMLSEASTAASVGAV